MNASASDQRQGVGCDTGQSVDEVRARIVAELARAMSVHPGSIDTAAPLHSLGASSLVAITITGELAQWLNRDLPATLMWDHESIDAVAEALGGAAVAPTIPPGMIALQAFGDSPPLFCFPGAGGHSTTFAPLARQLGPKQPIYGLIVPGMNGEREPYERIEDIAGAMIAGIRQVQRKGPYQFAGYSFGGLLAYEAALQMSAAGETVSLLAMYDTYAPKGRVLRPRWQRLALHAYFFATRTGRRDYMRTQLERRREERELRQALQRHADTGSDPSKRLALQVEQVNYRAAERYEAQPYPGVINLYRSAQRTHVAAFYRIEKTSNGWGALAPGRVRVIGLPGDHRTMLDSENASVAAEMLRPYLLNTD